MALQFADPVVNGNTLVRQAIRSPNYVPGVSGWSINKDGSVDFSNGTFRGSLLIGPAGNQLNVSTGLTPELVTFYGGVGVTLAGAMMQFISGTAYSYLVWGRLSAGVPFLAMGGVDSAGVVQEVWNNTGPNPAGDTEFNVFRNGAVPASPQPLTVTIGPTVNPSLQNPNNLMQITLPKLFLPSQISAQGATLDMTLGSATIMMDTGTVALTDQADYLYAGKPIGRGHFHSGRITADTAAISSLTSFIFGGSNAVFPTGRAFRLAWSGMYQASVAGVRISTQWSMLGSGAIVKNTNPVKTSDGTIIDGIEECNVIFVNTSGADVTDKIVGKVATNTGTVIIHAQSTPPKAESVFTVEDIGLATSFPDALSM